jgi:hypothetical protein
MKAAVKDAQRLDAAREGLLARHPLTFYFLIAYAFSSLVWCFAEAQAAIHGIGNL